MLFYLFIAILALAFVVITVRKLYKKNRKKYLVFSSVGDRNNVHSWLSDPAVKNFDFVVYYYGENDSPSINADYIVKRKGLKFENFYHFLKNNDVSQYDAVWVADDDIVMDTASISRMFELFSRYELLLAQPSFRQGANVSWQITRTDPDCVLRYTNFIENGVVVFSTRVLPLLMETFTDAGTGYGIDYIWPSLLDFPADKIAVIDAVNCHHPYSDYSALENVVPRHLHKVQGAELLIKYGLLPGDWQPTEENQWPEPYEIMEYSRVGRQNPPG